jgi:TIR domain-containing protein
MPEEAKRPLKVFLCHASTDKTAVRELYQRLTKDGVDAWLDKEKLLPGQDWEYEIRKAVREADVVVVCLSKQFNQAGFRQKEVRIALSEADMQPEGEIFIIPARLEECDTLESLRKWHWVDLFEEDGYERLMRALRARSEKIGTEIHAQPMIDDALLKIMVTGGRVTSKVVEELASLVGYQVVIRRHILLNNGTRGVDQKSAEGALRACKERNYSPDKFIRVFRPRKGSIPDFDVVKPIIVGETHDERTDRVIADSDVVILLGGGKGTRKAAIKAQNIERPIIPIGIGDSTEVAVDLWQKMFNGSYLENSPIGRNDLKRLNHPHSIEKIAVNAIILAENLARK